MSYMGRARGAKVAQTPRIMAESFVDGCVRGAVGQLERMVEWNHVDVEWRVQVCVPSP